jgi:hypothetical protein
MPFRRSLVKWRATQTRKAVWRRVAASVRAEAKRLQDLESQYADQPKNEDGDFEDERVSDFVAATQTGLWLRHLQRKFFWRNGIILTLGKPMHVTEAGDADPVLCVVDRKTLRVPRVLRIIF